MSTTLRRLEQLPYLVTALGVAFKAMLQARLATPATLIGTYQDDAYYYFTIARHLARGDGSTFDGLAATNGYHPLWLWLLTPLFALDPDPLRMLVWVKCFSALFWIASIALVWALARRLDAVAEVSVALPFLISLRGYWFAGMEATVVLTLALAVAYRSAADGLFSEPARARLLPVGILLGLALLARLDLIFFVCAVCGLFFVAASGLDLTTRLRRTIQLGLPSLAMLIAYMASNAWAFGTPSPVSGQAKTLGGPFWNPQVFGDYFLRKPVSMPLLRELPAWSWWLLLVIPALIVLRPRLGVFTGARRKGARDLELLLWALILGNLSQLGYYAVRTSWPLWRWYFYFLPLLFAVAVPVITMAGVELARLKRTRQLLPLIVALGAGIMIARGKTSAMPPPLTWDYKTQALAVTDFLERTLPADAVVAMGDRAGCHGYLLDRPLVQTEGLVGSKAFLDALAAGRVPAYLERQGVDAVIYSGGPASGGDPVPAPQACPDCLQIREPKNGRGPKFELIVSQRDLLYRQDLDARGSMGGTTWAWRYRPDLNPSRPD